jgi:aminobenzoyl-glutamate utilization protein A
MGEVSEWSEKLIQYRRLFHRYPEPGWLTFFSTVFVAEHLKRAGYEVYVGKEILRDEKLMDAPDEAEIDCYEELAKKFALEAGIAKYDYWLSRMEHMTGVVAVLDTKREGITKAFRFDMDALFVEESIDEERKPVKENFCSRYPGVSHACGHDGHMALGLTLAERLAGIKQQLSGKYLFIFQPAEEGVRGASAFCNQWHFGKVDQLFCCHIGFAPKDTFVAGAKGFLATTKFDADFYGKTAHAGLAPERGRNALLAAATAAVAMQEIKRPEGGITRLNVGQLSGGEARNVIPARAQMKIETRGETAQLNAYMKEQALECIRQAAKKYQVRYEITYRGQSLSAASDKMLSEEVLEIAKKCGEFQDYEITRDFGASDDGAVFMDMVQRQGGQAVFMLLGTALHALHHESEFDFSESVLERAFHVLYEIAIHPESSALK